MDNFSPRIIFQVEGIGSGTDFYFWSICYMSTYKCKRHCREICLKAKRTKSKEKVNWILWKYFPRFYIVSDPVTFLQTMFRPLVTRRRNIQKEEKCSWSFLPLFQIRIGEISTNCSWAEKKSEERKSHLPIEKPSKKLAKNISCFLLIKNLTYEYFPWLDFFCSFLASSFMRSDDV